MPKTILIVDDREEIRSLVQKILNRQEYDCQTAANALQARRLIAQQPVDLLICDIQMPGESGLEFTRFVSTTYPGTALLMLTIITDAATAEAAIDLGIDGYITKPFDKHALRIGVVNALRHRKLVAERNRRNDELEELVGKRTRQLREKIEDLVEIRESQKKTVALLEGIFHSSKTGIAICEPTADGCDFVFKEVNEAAEQLDGVDRKEVIGRRVGDVFPKIAAMGVVENAFDTWKSGKSRRHLSSFRRDDGTQAWRDFEFFKLPSGEVVCFYTDETQRKEAEHKVREQVQFLQNLIETIPNPLFFKDVQGHYLECNTAFEQFIGKTREEIVGRTAFAIQPEELAVSFAAVDRELLRQPGAREIETCIRHADGTRHDVIMTKTALREASGQVKGIVGVVLDVSERKKFEKALKESEAHFRAISDSAQDAIAKMDDAGRVTYWNPAAQRIFGFSVEEALGRDLHNLIAPERYHEIIAASLERFRQSGQRNTAGKLIEVQARCKDGREIPIELSISSVRQDGAWHAIGIVRDVSERKVLEERILRKNHVLKQARTELEEKNYKLEKAHADLKAIQGQQLQQEKMASIGQLAAGVAHEINNPTGFVSSNLKTLQDYTREFADMIDAYRSLIAHLRQHGATETTAIQERIDAIDEMESRIDLEYILEDTRDLIAESQEGTERIKKIVIDLKDFAHPGQQELVLADLHRNIDSVLNIVANEIKYKATVRREYGNLPEVQCYPQQLNQVFMNLMVNAAQAIEQQGEIAIATASRGDRVEIRISDTGSGIPEANLKKIFDPFFTTKPVGKGTGLGLNVAYNIVKKHGGTISATSTMGKGTTFQITLPIDQAAVRMDGDIKEGQDDDAPEEERQCARL